MRALIQQMKTVIEAVTEKLSKDPNTRVATSQESQAGRAQEPSLLKWLLSLGHNRPHPKGKLKGLALLPNKQGHSTKQEKNRTSSRMRTTQERKDLSSWKWRLPFAILGECRWTLKWKTRKHIQNALKNKVTDMNQTLQYSGINKTPTKNL